MIRNFVFILILGAGLWACSDVYTLSAEDKATLVDSGIESNASIDSIIAPYQNKLSQTMDEVIAYAPEDFTKGRPNGTLNDWAADAILYHELRVSTDVQFSGPVICLLNVGGLRNPISKGDVTVGDIYKLMPFDNEIVWVEMPLDSQEDIIKYLQASGGEPLSGAVLSKDKFIFENAKEFYNSFWVITSDYLMNGGDKMDFFEKKIRMKYGSGLMRDAMLNEAKFQDTLNVTDGDRIILE